MARLSVSLLGKPLIEMDGVPVEINRRKAIALLTYLAVTGEKQSRERLAGLFWPHENRDAARAALRRALTAIRHTIGREWLVVEGETIGLNLSGELWLDVKHFDSLLEKYRRIAVQGNPEDARSLTLLAEVARLYRSDFLSQFTLDGNTDFSEWRFFQAEDLRRKLAETLERLVRGHALQGEHELAVTYARRLLALDPLEERTHRSLMRLYAASGHPSLATRQYAECVRLLEKDLGVKPDAETARLAEDIKAKRPVDAAEAAAKAAHTPARAVPKPRRRILRIGAAAASGVVILLAAAFFTMRLLPPRPVTLAVLPFEDRSAAIGLDKPAEGAAEALVAELARSQRLEVKSALASAPYAGTGKPASLIARELGVENVVCGSFARDGKRIRIAVQLYRGRGDVTLWADIFERASDDPVTVQREVAAAAAARIREKLGVGE